MNFVDSRDLFGNGPTKEIPMLRAAGAPSTSTVGAVGCLYMDTDSGAAYKCTRVSDGAYTWVALIDKAEIQAIVDAYLEARPPSSDSGENVNGLSAALKTALSAYLSSVNTLIGQIAYAVPNPAVDTVISNANAVINALDGQPEQPASGIVQSGSILSVTSGVTVTQSGNELTIM